jgi:Raf kinase inhibitor-like YbhB/YbcL family protein
MKMPRSLLALPLLLMTAANQPFTLSSRSFADGAVLDSRHAGNLPGNPNCVGRNVSPQLSWSNVPEGTRSLVFFMVDPEGRAGAGVNHWVAYGVRPERGQFAEGEISQAPRDFVGGRSTQGLDHYMGPCTPPGTTYHHYTFVVVATDLDPDALPGGLTREEVLPHLVGHSKGASGLVGRFRHP